MAKQIKMLKKIKLELNEAHQKVLHWFFSFPDREIGLNDLAAEIKISKTTAKRIINVLVEEGFLNKKIYGKSWGIICNKHHINNYTLKIASNLGTIYGAYLGGMRADILKIVKNPKAIILFGSYRKGDDTEKSDIDIAVEVSDNEEIRIAELGTIPLLGYRPNVKVNLYIFSRNKIDLNLFSNIANGIVLEGFLEVRT